MTWVDGFNVKGQLNKLLNMAQSLNLKSYRQILCTISRYIGLELRKEYGPIKSHMGD